MKFFLFFLFCGITLQLGAQHSFRASIRNNEGAALPGATATWVEGKRSVVADSIGKAELTNLPAGSQTFSFSFVGFSEKTITAVLPLPPDSVLVLTLEEAEEEEEEAVIVTATRTSRTIANTPTRTEVISGEELEEKGNMKPGDIRMLLNESTGIQTQQTSATSYNAAIRIQGLEGRYTQLLRDGYPLYAGFSGGLSILQIAPLDLKQVEVIKGSSSTLYGGGAIAGLVNLVSKTPGEVRELSFLSNATTAGGLDLSGFYSERYGKTGLTVYGATNRTAPYDPAGIGLTAIPKATRYTLNPRLFLYGEKTTADLGLAYITENRTGGSIAYLEKGEPGYFERNETDRITSQLRITHQLSPNATLQLKSSYSFFDRTISLPTYIFAARQQSSFSELTWNKVNARTQWVVGANLITESLAEKQRSSPTLRDNRYHTLGGFVQHLWLAGPAFTLESGLRVDYTPDYGVEWLPRLSALFTLTPRLTTRIGGGFGYKTPSIFTEEAERRQFRNVLPIDPKSTVTERSVGGNWDINYHTRIGSLRLSINQLFFYTRLNRPLVLTAVSGDAFQFFNVGGSGYLDTKGWETNLRLQLGQFKFFLGYTYTDAGTQGSGLRQPLPLTARHRLNNVLMFEVEEKWKLGLEGYYFSPQPLSDRTTGKPYWITGFMAEKLWKTFSLFINFENFTDTRQTRFETIYTGSIDNPQFRDIYAPLDGFVVNGGLKIRL